MKSAIDLEKITPGVDYTSRQDKPSFYLLHCLKTNTDSCVIQVYGSADKNISFPAGSFVQGALYPIVLRKLVTHGNVEFMGYRQASSTSILD